MYKKIPVRTWYLKYSGSVPSIHEAVQLQHWNCPIASEYLQLYKRVGARWGWTGRLLLSELELQQKLNESLNEVWLFCHDGIVKGFFEIDRTESARTEIIYLGLLPEWIGTGLGKIFMEAAIAKALDCDDTSLWLHTCQFDHPKALTNYLNSGFEIIDEKLNEEYYPTSWLR